MPPEQTQGSVPETSAPVSSSRKKWYIVFGVVAAAVVVFFIAREVQAPEHTPNGQQGVPGNVSLPDIQFGKIVTDPSNGKEYMSNQIIVEFQPSVSEQDALALIQSDGGKMVARFTQAPVFLIQVDADKGDGAVTRSVRDKLAKDSRVKSADLNYLSTLGTSTAPEK